MLMVRRRKEEEVPLVVVRWLLWRLSSTRVTSTRWKARRSNSLAAPGERSAASMFFRSLPLPMPQPRGLAVLVEREQEEEGVVLDLRVRPRPPALGTLVQEEETAAGEMTARMARVTMMMRRRTRPPRGARVLPVVRLGLLVALR